MYFNNIVEPSLRMKNKYYSFELRKTYIKLFSFIMDESFLIQGKPSSLKKDGDGIRLLTDIGDVLSLQLGITGCTSINPHPGIPPLIPYAHLDETSLSGSGCKREGSVKGFF